MKRWVNVSWEDGQMIVTGNVNVNDRIAMLRWGEKTIMDDVARASLAVRAEGRPPDGAVAPQAIRVPGFRPPPVA